MEQYQREANHRSSALRRSAAVGSGLLVAISVLALCLKHTSFQWQAFSSFVGLCVFIARQLWKACTAADARAAALDDKLHTLVCTDEVLPGN